MKERTRQMILQASRARYEREEEEWQAECSHRHYVRQEAENAAALARGSEMMSRQRDADMVYMTGFAKTRTEAERMVGL